MEEQKDCHVKPMELREVLGKRAMDEHRWLELIEEVPADSIYYHTHSYFLRHAAIQQLYSNDFATWVVLYAQDRVLGERVGVPRDKSILLRVSRFDRFKDTVGVVAAYRLVKRNHDCRLVLAGGTSADDPEGAEVLAEVQEAVGTDPDVHILLLPPTANLEINALQRAATIIYQKSTSEGFGLTVAEALWKGKSVVGGETGGITVQLIPGVTGFTVNSPEGAAFYIRRLLNEPEMMACWGDRAKNTRGTGFSSRGIFKSMWGCSFIYSRELGMADKA